MKKKYSAEEKKAYFTEQKKAVDEALIEGVKHCYTTENFKAYLDTMRKLHNYSINNCMLITRQMPEATLIAGFNDWKRKFKRSVKKGEKGIKILAPVPCKFTAKDTDENGNEVERQVEYMRFKVVSVFDYSQTDGEEIPSICNELKGEVKDYDDIIASLIGVANVPVSFAEVDKGNGYFSPLDGKIVIKDGMSQAQTVKTLVHEIAHSILHAAVFCEIPRDIKEMQAESVAYMVCSELGIDTSDYSFEYVASWAHQDMKALQDQMTIVRKTADRITESLKH